MHEICEDIHKQESAVFRIKGLNTPWKEVIHLGIRKHLPRFHETTHTMEDNFFFLLEGTLRLSCISCNGQERVLMFMEKENIVGELTILHKASYRTHSLRTLSPCEVVYFPKSLLEDESFCEKHPGLILNLVRSIGIKAGAFFSQIYDSALLPARAQVCRTLHQLWQQHGQKKSFAPGISQSDLTHILGIHRSSVCRIVRELRETRVIGSFSKNNLEIRNPRRLMELAEVIEIEEIS